MPGTPTALRVQIHIQPRAARTRIVGRHGDALKVQVHAPPVDGAANAALVALLADTLHLPRRAIRILRGASAREKLIEIECPDPDASRTQLYACVDKKTGRG